ncbi:hypothetical protein H632_c445p0 [Helicosporidium sp. ATCC 50920]|nr:hypothetical protein H632_c445p0 [Helicosporidium sp. ATCC 50920]|eukprot:KDD75902.1 hypothetical protein H632_c445p0 [Helicosporidium sp. ATCC 50920]
MGIMDRLRGRRAEEAAPVDESSLSAAMHASPSGVDLSEAPPLPVASPSSSHGDPFAMSVDQSARFYNPYEGLGAALDRGTSRPQFRLSSQPEFLFSEEAAVRRRSWSENLTYYTGVGYLGGSLLGGGRGFTQAFLTPVAVAGAESSKRLRLNQFLNSTSKAGGASGNALGVLGLLFASSESFLGYLNDGALPEQSPTLAAGALTGALYRSVRGPRQAAAAAAVGTLAATGLLAARAFVNSGL